MILKGLSDEIKELRSKGYIPNTTVAVYSSSIFKCLYENVFRNVETLNTTLKMCIIKQIRSYLL